MGRLSKKTMILVIFFLLLAVSIPVGVYLVSQPQDVRKGAFVDNGTIDIKMSPASGTLNTGGTQTVTISVNTNGIAKGITAVGALLSFTYSGNEPDVTVSNIQKATNDQDWNCSPSNHSASSGTYSIHLACTYFKTSTEGFSSSGYEDLVQFDLVAGTSITSRDLQLNFSNDASKVVATLKVKKEGSTTYDDAMRPTTNATFTLVGGSSVTPTPTSMPMDDTTSTSTSTSGTTPTPTPTTSSGSSSSTLTPTPTTSSGIGGTIYSTPTPTSKLAAGTSGSTGTSSSTTLTVTGVKNNQSLTTSLPTFSGKAAPNAKVTVTVQSTPQTAIVTASSTGTWSYTPTTPLEPGSHTLIVQAQNTSGVTETQTVKFSVTTPVTGSFSQTLLLLFAGLLLIGSGWIIRKKEVKLPQV